MDYAIHYVRVNGIVYTPGEVIPDGIDAANRARLLRIGAIGTSDGAADETAGSPAVLPGEPDPAEQAPKTEDPEAEASDEPVPEIDFTDCIGEDQEQPKKAKARSTTKAKSTKSKGGKAK